MNNHEHMCMDGDNLATENRLEISQPLLCQIVTLDLISRGGLGAGTILGGAGGSSVINSLKSYPDLIKKYQVSSIEYQVSSIKYRPDQEVSGPLQETSRAGKVWPHH